MKKYKLYHPFRHLIIALGFISSLCFSSCNFLEVDYYFDDTMKFDSIFINYENLSKYVWGASNLFPDESAIFNESTTPGPLSTDEAFTSFDPAKFYGMKYVLGGVNADNINDTKMNIWGTMYKIIRKCNYILSRKSEAGLSTLEDEEITGFTHMLRGYAYYNLIQAYGPCVLVGDEILPNNELPSAYNISRSTYDESVDYCCEELEQAARYLPEEITSNFYGRPSRGAAFALIARLRLQQASPLYNGGQAARTFFGTWKRTLDGKHYVNQTYDERRWAVAAAACKRVINMNRYSLHTSIPMPGKEPRPLPATVQITDPQFQDIDYYLSYADMFTGESQVTKNPEFIWAIKSKAMQDMTQYSFPVKDIMGGYNVLCLTQKLVDAYYMVDGRDKDKASEEYPYHVTAGMVSEDYFSTKEESFSGYKIPVGVYGMYLNRENRFYATVGFSGRYWAASSCADTKYNAFTVFYDQRSTSGKTLFAGKGSSLESNLNYPSTGYVLTKWIHPSDAWNGNGSARTDKYFPIIRYAEILLGYAEALNHLTQSYTVELGAIKGGNQPMESYTVSRDMAEIKKNFDQIRNRVGLPGLTNEELSLGEEAINNLIKRECMIEFACENRRYYDVRRWGDYEEAEKTGIYGMRVEGDQYDYYRLPAIPINQVNNRNRIINKKMILLPLPKAEVRRVENLDQNPGWEN